MGLVPRDEEGQPTSIGSMLHASGACTLCGYAVVGLGKHDAYCFYFHVKHSCRKRHAGKSKMRPGSSKRARLRKQAVRLCQQIESDLGLDLDSIEMPSSLLPWADALKTRLRSYQRCCWRNSRSSLCDVIGPAMSTSRPVHAAHFEACLGTVRLGRPFD